MTETQNVFTEIFTVIPDSKSKIKSSSYLESGKYAVVDQGKELIAGYTDTSPTVVEKLLPVIVFGDHTRAVKYVDFPFTAGADGTQILKPSSLTNPKYGFYLVLHAVGQIPSKGYARHFGELKKMKFQLPSLEKQQEIVEKLDSVFAEIELAKTETIRSIQNLSDLTDSKLDEVFTKMEAEYGMVQSGTVIDVRDGTHDSPSYLDSGYPLITSKNLRDGSLDFSKVSFITEEDYQKINRRSKVDVGDLLFAMIGTIGNPVVVMENPFFAIKNVGLFKANPNYDMTFLSYFLRTPRIREKFEREAKGTTQRFLGLGYLRTLDIPNVPIKDQLESVKKLNQFKNELKKLEQNLAQRLENFSELKNSIMSSIFIVDSEEEAIA